MDLVYKALERVYDTEHTPEHVWEPVLVATRDKQVAVEQADQSAKEARLAVALLKETLAHGIKADASVATPAILTLDESVGRALYVLETAKVVEPETSTVFRLMAFVCLWQARVEAAQVEARVMDEYRNLIDTARRHLRLEVSSLRPELAATLDAAHIGADELNILMAHAYWKILTLQKELSRQQALEQQRLLSAVDVQRREDEHVMESRLRVEMEKQYYELKAQFSQEVRQVSMKANQCETHDHRVR